MAPTLYQLKRAALTPRTLYMRRKEAGQDPRLIELFEQNYYRKPYYDFLGTAAITPDLLTDDLALDQDSIVFDVGAHNGEWAEKLWDLYQPTIYAFEPAPPVMARLEARLGPKDRAHVMGYGLGASSATLELTLRGPASNLYADDGGEALKRVPVQVRDVVEVLDELEVDRISLLKINIEGGEYDLIDRLADTGWLPRIDQVQVQFHEWHADAYRRRRRNRRDLARTHDEVWCWSWVWERWSLRDPG